MKSVFISRDLGTDSVFCQNLEAAGWKVYGESLVQFDAVPFELPFIPDWIFFTSRKGVSFFYDGLLSKHVIKDCKLACMGRGTAEELIARGIVPDLIGNGRPDDVAEVLGQEVLDQSVLFPVGARSLRSVQGLLDAEAYQEDLVIYRQKKRTGVSLPSVDVYVLTSPMNAEAFFELEGSEAMDKVVAIGKTTARSLQDLGFRKVQIAHQASERGLVRAVLELS